MPRPKKHRRICKLPDAKIFGPLDKTFSYDKIIMTIDEYETIRQIDLEGLTQEESADRMNVARTTIQSIYASARQKIALSIVTGQTLVIEGGDYSLCSLSAQCNCKCGCGCPCSDKNKDKP